LRTVTAIVEVRDDGRAAIESPEALT
jgi:hypothetical protein